MLGRACNSTSPSTIVIPRGTWSLSQVKLLGPNKAPIELQVQGTLQANPNPGQLPDKQGEWITINYVNYFTLSVVEFFDGQGQEAWKQNDCHKNRNCAKLPMGEDMASAPATLTVSDLHFEDLIMDNRPSSIKISNVSIKNVRGTTNSAEAVTFICSGLKPCENVEVGDIDLTYTGNQGPITTKCANVNLNLSASRIHQCVPLLPNLLN
ncbi:UNVERIFIED_CONTAM: Polygalacturonase [Sesamum latifolium]|uniref:Polygalacturonase n=1 Tax=Sesamum latifolium TaxID=2727402 RepID=A0AAW2YA17_9LAMI